MKSDMASAVMKSIKKLTLRKASSRSAAKRTSRLNVKKQRQIAAAERFARRVERWHKRLAPQFPEIDPHDLHLIIESLLRTRKQRMEVMLVKRREDGFYVF